jgi:lauroyl/myristoyl acyltransferase
MRALARLLGWSYLRNLVEIYGEDALKARGARGALVVSWHWGLGAALLAALGRIGETGLVLRYRDDLEAPVFASIVTGDELKTRAQAVEAALRRLRAGGVVVIFQDVYGPEEALLTRPLPLWSRDVRLPAGPASLARLGRADVYVAHAFWRGGSPPIRVEIAPPIAPPGTADGEWAWTEDLGRRFERAILLDPGELWPVSLRFIERSPRRTAPDRP